MMLLKFLKVNKLQWLFAVALLGSLLWSPAEAHAADGWTCSPGNTGSGGVVTCSSGGGGGGSDGSGGGGHEADHSWTVIAEYPDEPCIDQYGAPSYYVDIVQYSTGAVLMHHCTTQNTTGTAPTLPTEAELKADAANLVTIPEPTADFKGDFITGAPVTFSAGALQVFQQDVPQVAGAYLNATPVPDGFSWDYGDGTTGAGPNPAPKIYESISPHSDNPDNHTVSVTVTGTWHLYFHQQAADGSDAVQDLGTVTKSGTLNPNPRTIVQVWSAQTEPK